MTNKTIDRLVYTGKASAAMRQAQEQARELVAALKARGLRPSVELHRTSEYPGGRLVVWTTHARIVPADEPAPWPGTWQVVPHTGREHSEAMCSRDAALRAASLLMHAERCDDCAGEADVGVYLTTRWSASSGEDETSVNVWCSSCADLAQRMAPHARAKVEAVEVDACELCGVMYTRDGDGMTPLVREALDGQHRSATTAMCPACAYRERGE